MNAKEIASRNKGLQSGHRLCAGCGIPIIIKQVLSSVEEDVVVSCATGCLEVSTTPFPYSSWNVPWIHNAFENAAATISGVETAYKVLKKKGKIKKNIKFLAIGGDGGTYDIGLQSLSGALERGHDFVYICYDNGIYSNTGAQRSSATPYGANTTTTPAGKKIKGKLQRRKDLTEIAIAHKIPYVAQTAVHAFWDLTEKVKFAIKNTPSVIVVLEPCPTNWKFSSDLTIELSKKAVETCFWPLYEYKDGKYRINYKPKKKLPVEEFLKLQGRFKHLFKEGNEKIIKEIQNEIDKKWNNLLKLEDF
ncbi:MAG: pyruvate ferredoxin oxidoreductase [Candidatus Aenigmarchaeota archaeon ex4484_56]|nr:MAG: pyruvate ferredoxin oxidoreductase [Candidatus Aenigmarchaeota archaeon ex4484_56]